MKNYKQILEAVNRGIQLALDDFDDEEQIQNIKSKQVQNRDYTKEYLDNTKELVDLGLPSGTLWFNYNYGVDHKKIYEYTKPEDFYGLYLSFGEKKIKLYYAWDTYAYCKYPQREKRKLTKYCNLDDYWALKCDIDDLSVLEPQDDIITFVYGPGYHIPTIDQYNELLQYTESFPIEDYLGIHGLDGRIFKSKINQNQIFFPYNGIKSGSTFLWPDAGWTECILQTSNISLKNPLYCKVFHFSDSDYSNEMNDSLIKTDLGQQRCLGLCIRGVYNNKI